MIDTNVYKSRLEAQLKDLTSELSELGILEPNTGDWIATPEDVDAGMAAVDENVQADTVEDWNERRATMARLETRYNNIKLALKKIGDGTYGVCEIGGEAIEEDRLDANPAARTCKQHLEEEENLI